MSYFAAILLFLIAVAATDVDPVYLGLGTLLLLAIAHTGCEHRR